MAVAVALVGKSLIPTQLGTGIPHPTDVTTLLVRLTLGRAGDYANGIDLSGIGAATGINSVLSAVVTSAYQADGVTQLFGMSQLDVVNQRLRFFVQVQDWEALTPMDYNAQAGDQFTVIVVCV